MPIYEYTCKDCDESFEALVRESAEPVCASCQSGNVERRLSLFAVGSSGQQQPECAGGCCGFDKGSCGSGLCGSG